MPARYLWRLLVLVLLPVPRAEAQVPGIDIQHYTFQLTLSDETDRIEGNAVLDVRFVEDGVRQLPLDLEAAADAGMVVRRVEEDGRPVDFTHAGQRLAIALPSAPRAGEERRYRVVYDGVPEDGLIIAENRHGSRTFFGDNWPNRARHWLPSVDHPSDKATNAFIVTAPSHYQVVANGTLVEETDLGNGMRRTHWRTEVPLPTKVMVIGAAQFAVRHDGAYEGIPIQAWVYPEDREAGFYDFGVTRDMLAFFTERIGPFPYEKLANVQSKTRYGGMENASAIFYNENAISGERRNESTVAHEIAHQWFGDSVTEADWPHIWLSEGFATYFAQLYFEEAVGRERLVQGMSAMRDAVLRYYQRNPDAPLVDGRPTDPNDHLNTNSYQKGGWVLHMLRRAVGDSAFWAGIRTYYRTHRDGNATSEDLQRAMEAASGVDLSRFFAQWLYRAGQPHVRARWSAAGGRLAIDIEQIQEEDAFDIPLDIAIQTAAGVRVETIALDRKRATYAFDVESDVEDVRLDPNVWLLMASDIRRH